MEDGAFALEVLEYINKRATNLKKKMDICMLSNATPAENLCGLQVKQFRKKYGIVEKRI